MAIGSGMAGQIGYAVEVTPGTPVVTGMAFIPLAGKESLTTERDRTESEGIIAGRRILDASMWNGGLIKCGGDIPHELYNKGIGKLFTGMFGTVTSTTGPVSTLYTHTWTGPGAPASLTIQKGVPSVTGTVNPFTYAGCKVESWEMGCKAGEIVTLGLTVAGMNETQFRSVTDGVTTSASAAITSATAAFRPDDIGKPISGTGIPALATILSVQSATNATLSANATATGSSITFSIGIALASATYPSLLAPFKYTHGAITFGGSSLKCKEVTLAGNNGMDSDRYFIGQRGREVPLEAGLHEMTGSLTIEFTDMTQYSRFIAETTHALVVGFTNSLGESVTFTMNARVDGVTPVMEGRGIVTQEMAFKAVGSTDAAAFSIVVVSTDTTP